CNDDESYVVAKLKLEGDAQSWYQKNQDKIGDWNMFNQSLSQRFPAVASSNDREILRQLKITTPQQFFNVMPQQQNIQVRLSNLQLSGLGTTATIQQTSTRKGVQQLNTFTTTTTTTAVSLYIINKQSPTTPK
ncbi:unnamed protein product, partial [Didymodactylos carnosus]